MADGRSRRDRVTGASGDARDMAASAKETVESAQEMAAAAREMAASARQTARDTPGKGKRDRERELNELGKGKRDRERELNEPGKGKRARELNELIRYTMWSVFRVADPAGLGDYGGGRDAVTAEVAEMLEQAAGKGITTRGAYDIQGLRADADYMFWWVADSPDDLQETYTRFRRTRLGRASQPVWSVMALHRPAEFNKGHVPAFLAGEEPRSYVSVYPFVRSYEWYLLDPDDRRAQLAEHGMMAREYPDVRANTVACFALNDYEWILAFEADELHRILDLMRHLRGAQARRHTRAEIPFFAGRRKPLAELVAALP